MLRVFRLPAVVEKTTASPMDPWSTSGVIAERCPFVIGSI